MGILIVDDTPVNLMLLEDMLQQEGYDSVHCVRSGEEALSFLDDVAKEGFKEQIDLILMDVMMPGVDGIETCRRVKAQDLFKDIPIIMITVRDDEEALAQAFAAGAIDYIIKPVKEVELLARVRSALKLKEEINRRKERERELIVLTKQLDAINRRLMRLAHVDSLTEIGNRRYFDEILEKEWQRAKRENNTISLIMVDIDEFRAYNDTYGHQKGDECLQQVASALNCVIKRAGDTIVRYGGEEFVAILPNTENDGALAVAQEFQENVAKLGIEHEGTQVSDSVTVSIGLATAQPSNGDEMQGMMAAADGALYLAKNEGRNRIKVAHV